MKIEITLHLPDTSSVILDLDEAKAVFEELKKLFEPEAK
jgi:hypothetical protein